MSPSAVALLLNDYLSRMTDVIFKYEGTLDKYIGDAIMAVFGAPLDMPDHAARAIHVGPRDAGAARRSSTPSARKGPHLRIRIGINSGKAVAGEIGSINKKEYTVLGDTVNTASRLESSVAKPGHGRDRREHLRRRSKDQFECKSLGPATLKGKEKEVAVYEVIGARAGRRDAAPPPARRARGLERDGARRARAPPRAHPRSRCSLLLFVVGVVPAARDLLQPRLAQPRRSSSSTRRRIQLDKARSLSQQVAVYVAEPARAGRRPSPAPSRWRRRRAVHRPGRPHPRREGARALRGRQQPLLLRERRRRRAGSGAPLGRPAPGAGHRRSCCRRAYPRALAGHGP